MKKTVFIAEKPSVAEEFAKALNIEVKKKDGYIDGESVVVTWCIGHLVTMSYPEVYDEKYKKWRMEDLPFIPQKGEWKYEIIPSAKKQYNIVKAILCSKDVDTIYVCTDSGREGEYIYRLVANMAGVAGKTQKRVWIDSQTKDEILRGIREAKDLREYDNLAAAAYLRAMEDYLMGINFSRLLSLKYGPSVNRYLGGKWHPISVGRVMTCVLGMICEKEHEIRNFKKMPFYKVLADLKIDGRVFETEWKVDKDSIYYESNLLYRENGFKEKTDAEGLISILSSNTPSEMTVSDLKVKSEKKQPPLLFNLAELQNACSKSLKISPADTLNIIQDLYEAKLVTYPRTDARVISSAVAKDIVKNISGLKKYAPLSTEASYILDNGKYKNLVNTRYVDDKKITDHYAIIPTGQGLTNLSKQKPLAQKVYDMITRRFLAVFYPPAVYKKATFLGTMPSKDKKGNGGLELFAGSIKALEEKGYLCLYNNENENKNETKQSIGKIDESAKSYDENEKNVENAEELLKVLKKIKKGDKILVDKFLIKEGETTPPKRYTSGSLVLAMENAGQLIEDEEMRALIKGSGIGTSATRADIIKKLTDIDYISINKKNQQVAPTQLGEMVYGIVRASIKSMLDPRLTASWELGLSKVADGDILPEEYMEKLDKFIRKRFENAKDFCGPKSLNGYYDYVASFYG